MEGGSREVMAHPGKYILRDPHTPAMLRNYRHAGKKVLCTCEKKSIKPTE